MAAVTNLAVAAAAATVAAAAVAVVAAFAAAMAVDTRHADCYRDSRHHHHHHRRGRHNLRVFASASRSFHLRFRLRILRHRR